MDSREKNIMKILHFKVPKKRSDPNPFFFYEFVTKLYGPETPLKKTFLDVLHLNKC